MRTRLWRLTHSSSTEARKRPERKTRGRKEDKLRKRREQRVKEKEEEGTLRKKSASRLRGCDGLDRRTRKKSRKTVQIFVKVDGPKVTPMEVTLTDDKVEDVMRRIQKDEDAYVTMQGKVLRTSEKLKSCGVTDGCTIQVTSRMRRGGRHKDKKTGSEKKYTASAKGNKQKSVEEPKSDEGPAMIQMDEVLRRMEENEEFQKNIDWVSEGSEGEVQQKIQSYLSKIWTSWMSKEKFEHLEGGVWRAVEVKRKERGEDQEQRRQEEQEQIPEETRAESTDEPEVTCRLAEVRTGRGSVGFVQGADETHRTNETSGKVKGKANGGTGEHGGKDEKGGKGFQQSVKMLKGEEDQEADGEDERGRVAPIMEAGGSHPQATSDPGKKEKEEKEARVLRWSDCKDEGMKENEEEVEEEKVTGQWEMTDERPPGLEEVESELKTQEEEKPNQVESKQEAQEEDKQSQVENEQEAQEEERRRAREEQRRAQEAREEERTAQKAQEQKRAQKAREEEQRRAREAREEEKKVEEAREEEKAQEMRREKRVQEAREKEAKAQEEREREVSAYGERERQVREVRTEEERTEQERKIEAPERHECDVKAQEGHEGEVEAQDEQEEDANSLHEESHVSNRHTTWWHNAWWVRVNNGPHLRTARDRRRVWRAATRAAQEVRETGKVAGGEREMGDGKKRKQHIAHRLPLSHCKHCNSNTSGSSSSSDGALAVIFKTKTRRDCLRRRTCGDPIFTALESGLKGPPTTAPTYGVF